MYVQYRAEGCFELYEEAWCEPVELYRACIEFYFPTPCLLYAADDLVPP